MSLNTGNAILSNAITVDGSYNVGIGTTTPLGKLHVSSPTAVSAYIVSSGGDYDTNLYLGYGSVYTDTYIKRVVGNLSLGTSATDRLYISSGGNVGIGTTSPSQILHVYGTSIRPQIESTANGGYSTLRFVGKNSGGTSRTFEVGLNVSADDVWQITNGTTAFLNVNTSGNVGIGTISPNTLLQVSKTTNVPSLGTAAGGFSIRREDGNVGMFMGYADSGNSWIQVQRTDSATAYNLLLQPVGGNVGIGTSSPESKLQVEGGELRVTTSNAGVAAYYTAGNGELAAYNWGGAAWIPLSYAGQYHIWRNSGNEVMRITSGGNLCLGTTTKIDDGLLSISADSALYQGITIKNTNTAFIYYIYFKNSSNAAAGRIEQTGATSVAYASGSDYRLKEDLKDFNGLDKVLSIKTYDFKWKNEDRRDFGVLAHELQEVVSGAVLGKKDELEKDGTIKTQMVDYSKIVPVLVKAIQELSAKVTALENTITDQQQQINQLINK